MTLIPEEKINQVREAAPIVEVVSDYVALTKRGTNHQGLCPFHGEKTPSFNVNSARNTFHCFGCGIGGGAITFLEKIERISFPQAVKKLAARYGIAIEGEKPARQNPAVSASVPPGPRSPVSGPAIVRTPADIWQASAQKLVDQAHEALLEYYQKPWDAHSKALPGTPAEYLQNRGISFAAVVKNQLGWLAGDPGKNCIYRPLKAWGLPPEVYDKGPKKGQPKHHFWIPRGIVITSFVDGKIDRIRIRRPNKDLDAERRDRPDNEPAKYIAIKGGGNQTISLNPQAPAQIAIESDLDAILVDHLAGDLVGAIPLTTVSVIPNGQAAEACQRAVVILVALDFDTPKTVNGKLQRAGETAWRTKWQPTYPQAVRWPAPAGKDPGEAYEQGADLRAWVMAGLPVSLHPPVKREDQPPFTSHIPWRTKTGRLIYIADSAQARDRLRQPGQAWFTQSEMLALKGLSEGEIEAVITAKERIIDVKELFGGEVLRVKEVE